jgi:FAD/FMN-containing dehydrogenase
MAWVDCNAQGSALGRGIFFRGNHLTAHEIQTKWKIPTRTLTMPMDLPSFALNRWTVQAFNFLYYNRQRQKSVCQLGDYDPFFYPLDAILKWNRLYGKRGFLQYQCVVPYDDQQIITEIMQTIAQSGLSSFLAVLKTFGDLVSPGLLSYPRKGVNLALDFPMKGFKTFELLAKLDEIVSDANGSVNPSKDARLSARHFQQYYPHWETFSQFIDPQFSSSFWRRVTTF